MNNIILEVKNLSKVYNSISVVDGISFSVPKGKIIGLLGPNGAGKTTTIHMLLGITLPTSGQINFFGKDFTNNRAKILQRINYTSSYNSLQDRITVWENLLVFAYLYGIKTPQSKIRGLLEYFEVENLSNYTFKDLSSGQRTRVNLIKSLLNDPELILMDEPTASLDPDIADKTLLLIENLNKTKNLSILYTSHNMDEVTRICDEVIFLDHGKIVAQDSPLGLTKRLKESQLQVIFDGNRKVVENYLDRDKQSFAFLNNFTVIIKTQEKLIAKLIIGINQTGVIITDIEVKKPTLEDFFLHIARKK